MPWNETCAMKERIELIEEYLAGEDSVSELARRYGVSRKTVHKWILRFRAEGLGGLAERSRAPQHHPHALAEALEQQILEWKAKKPLWGAPKIHAKLLALPGCPSESTVSNVLARHGLSRKARRRRSATPSQWPLAHCQEV